ncbi:uncharacterized protein LOC135117356 [Helicoverpa armigera]|uniref:uncharacterized protein LOC135117356 n=1 Tax=Helicoverpa armigera TaxID=29058 RepID=UPI003083BB16
MARNIEELSEDLFTDDFIRIFQPILFVLRALGLARVSIKYRYPTGTSKWYLLYSNVFWLLNALSAVYFFFHCGESFDSKYANSTLKFGVLNSGINGILVVFRNNLERNNKFGAMYVKLQKIERYLNMEDTKSINKQLRSQSTIVMVVAFFVTIFWIVLFKYLFMKSMCIPLIVNVVTSIGLQTEMAQIYFIIKFIVTRVYYINDILRQVTLLSIEPLTKPMDDGILFVVSNTLDQDGELPGELVSGMHCIFQALSDFTGLFQFSLFYFVCQILAWNLVTIHYLVTSMKEQGAADTDLLLCVMPVLVALQFIILTLCLKAQDLSTKLEESRKLCIDIISSPLINGKSREHAKRLILLVEGRRSVSIYNICTFGTRLPLHLLAITASYTVVLLQLALL